MKKNSKGFTLVELLATIVILGILLVVAVPTVINMVDTNRNKMYIDAAKKLVAQAEYQMRANSSKIEKPKDDKVIAISMVYLDSSDFDTTPTEGGEYIKEASFVVVKDTEEGLEYSVTVVEKLKKGGYKGVELTLNSNLSKRNANKYVKVFEEDELIFVENNAMGEILSPDIINDKLGNDYCSSIDTVYNRPDLSDSTAVKDTDDSPIIKSVTLVKGSNTDYNSWEAILSLKAVDDKTLQSELEVFTSEISYDDALSKKPDMYGKSNQYTKNFNFLNSAGGGDENDYSGQIVPVYVVVRDKAGNMARKTVTYQIHKNTAPIINTNSSKTYITKRPEDPVNLQKTQVFLDVTDDITKRGDLQVCLTDVENGCTSYKPYSEFFASGSAKFEFDCELDGQERILYIYVKDGHDNETSHQLKYKVHLNKPPTITSFKVVSNDDKFLDANKSEGGHKTARVHVKGTDDIDIKKTSLRIYLDGVQYGGTYPYSVWGNDSIPIEFKNAKYDGSTHKVKIELLDQLDEKVTDEVSYKLYKNKPPTIKSMKVTSDGVACDFAKKCPTTDGGSLKTIAKVEIEDDIDYANLNDLLVCVSENSADCSLANKNDKTKFKKYADYFGGVGIKLTPTDVNNPYKGENKKIHFAVIDSYGEYTTSLTTYKLYTNKKPTVRISGIETEKDSNINYDEMIDFLPININKAKITFTVEDDFEIKNSKVKIYDDLTNTSGQELTGDKTSAIVNIDNKGKYTGQTVTITVSATDEYGGVGDNNIKYSLYNDKAPKIDSFKFESNNTKIHDSNVKFEYKVRDPLDKLDICIGELPDDYSTLDNSKIYKYCQDNAVYKSSDIDGNDLKLKEGTEKTTWEYDGKLRKLYLVVKDSNNKYAISKGVNYTIYHECTMANDDGTKFSYKHVENEKNPVISATTCKGKCWRADIREIDKENNILTKYLLGDYEVTRTFNDIMTNKACKVTDVGPEDCSLYTCYKKNDSEFYKAVGNTKVNGNYTHKDENGKNHVDTYYYKIYTVKVDSSGGKAVLTDSKERTCEKLYEKGYYTMENGYVETDDSKTGTK